MLRQLMDSKVDKVDDCIHCIINDHAIIVDLANVRKLAKGRGGGFELGTLQHKSVAQLTFLKPAK